MQAATLLDDQERVLDQVLFLYFFIEFSLFVLSFFLLYLLDQVLRQAARIVEQQVTKRVQFVVNSKQCDHILYCHHEMSK